METILTWQPPLPGELVLAAYSELRERGILVGSFDPSQEKTYNPETYVMEHCRYGTQFSILADRNIFSLARDLAFGRSLPPTEMHWFSAFMIVAMIHDMQIEPCLAVYEYAWRHGNDLAKAEIAAFNHANNIPLNLYASLFGEDICRLPGEFLYGGAGDEGIWKDWDFCSSLKDWEANYPLVLKVAQLERTKMKPVDRLRDYLDWMWADYMFTAPGVKFGFIYLSPSKGGHKGMIKNLNGTDLQRRREGIENACWDLCLVQDWLGRVRRQPNLGTIWLLASNDRALVDIAKGICTTEPEEDRATDLDSAMAALFREVWGPIHGRELHEHYLSKRPMNRILAI